MKRFTWVALIAAAGALVTVNARAEEGAQHGKGGLGFHSLGGEIATGFNTIDLSAPLGIRWWLSGGNIAIDLGFGFNNHPGSITTDEKETNYAVEVGVPIVIKSWDRVHALFRPGFTYASAGRQEFDTTTPDPTDIAKLSDKAMLLSAEVEAEVFLVDNFSVSASHGIAWASVNRDEEPGVTTDYDNLSQFGTFERNATEIGFHLYLW